MTSFAFILGVVPLVIAVVPAAKCARTLGTAVFGGMLGVTAVRHLFDAGLLLRHPVAGRDAARNSARTPLRLPSAWMQPRGASQSQPPRAVCSIWPATPTACPTASISAVRWCMPSITREAGC